MSKKTKSTTKPWKAAQPYILGGAKELQNTYDQEKGDVGKIADDVQSLIPGLMDKFQAGNENVNAATGYNTDVLGGKYLDQGNPYLSQMIGQTSDSVGNRVNAAIGQRGGAGGSAHNQILSRELANSENALRYGDYNSQMGRMDAAASRSPALAAADYTGISPLLAAAEAGTQLPFAASNNLAQGVGGLLGPYTTQTQKQGAGAGLSSLLGAGLAGWASGGFGGIK